MKKNKKGQGAIIAMSVGVIILAIILGVIFNFITTEATSTQSIGSETITITFGEVVVTQETLTISSAAGQTANVDLISLDFFGNSTHNNSNVILGTDLNWTREGVITVNTINFSDIDYNVSYTYIENGTGQTTNDDLVDMTFFGNSTVNTSSTGIAINTEVNFTGAGVITPNANNFTAGDYNIAYSFFPDGYITSATTRTLINLVPVLAALAVLLFVFAFVAMKGK